MGFDIEGYSRYLSKEGLGDEEHKYLENKEK